MLPIDLENTVLSQYGGSKQMLDLIQSMNDFIDPRADLGAFYDLVWNIDTAVGYGLDVWGRIIGVGRSFTYKAVTYTLADSDYRGLLMVKALANIVDSSVPSFNRLLTALYQGVGDAYVLDTGGMTMIVLLQFLLSPIQEAILVGSGFFPHPAGVGSYVAPIPPGTYFGFDGSTGKPFGQAPFFPGVIDA